MQKASLPIFIHNGRNYFTAPTWKRAVGRPMNPHYVGLVLKLIVNHDVYNSSQFNENKVSSTGAYVNKVSKIMASCSPGGVHTGIAKHHGRYSKSDHLCQDGEEWTSRRKRLRRRIFIKYAIEISDLPLFSSRDVCNIFVCNFYPESFTDKCIENFQKRF